MFFRDQVSDKHRIGYYVINLDDSVGGDARWTVMNIKRDNWIL